jgi:hypothetical protein
MRVAAGAPAAIEASGELPCSRDELAEALALRVDGRAVHVEARGDRVRIRVGDRARELVLGGARGRAAARLIALTAADLSMDELPTDAPPPPVAGPPRPRVALAVTARAGSSDAFRAGVAIDAAIGRGRWRPLVEAGVAGGVGDHDVRLLAAPLRAGVAWGEDSTLRATAVVLPYTVSGGVGHRGVLAGGGIEGRGQVRAGGVTVVFAAGVDILASQVELRYDGAAALTTPRVQAWTVLGIAWEVTP